MRAVDDPVRGVKDIRLADDGPPNENEPARDKSTDISAPRLTRRLSVCSRMRPRLRHMMTLDENAARIEEGRRGPTGFPQLCFLEARWILHHRVPSDAAPPTLYLSRPALPSTGAPRRRGPLLARARYPRRLTVHRVLW